MSDSPRYSVSPSGENFTIPAKSDYQQEFDRLTVLTKQAREEGKEIVVVMGVGFVGAVMAAIVADTRAKMEKIQNSLSDASDQVPEVTGRFLCSIGENLL